MYLFFYSLIGNYSQSPINHLIKLSLYALSVEHFSELNCFRWLLKNPGQTKNCNCFYFLTSQTFLKPSEKNRCRAISPCAESKNDQNTHSSFVFFVTIIIFFFFYIFPSNTVFRILKLQSIILSQRPLETNKKLLFLFFLR